MRYKRIMSLIILMVSLLVVSTVSAADNNTNDILMADNDNQTIIEKNNDVGTFTALANEIANANGELNLTKNYTYVDEDSGYKSGIKIDKTIKINGNGFTINGDFQARIFNIAASNVVLNNICFEKAFTSNRGGAVLWSGENGVLTSCCFVNCSGYGSGSSSGSIFGGAVYWSGANGTLVNSSFVNSSSYSSGYRGYGGAVYWFGDSGYLFNCVFVNSSSGFSYRGYGGAVYWLGANGTLDNCYFVNSSSYAVGGAVYWNVDCGVLANCCFVNSSSYDGGAVYWNCAYGTLFNCSFVNSSSCYDGGAIFIYSSYNHVNNCDFINCFSGRYGGGICFEDSDCSLINSSFKGNTALSGPDWYCILPIDVINVTTDKILTVLSASDINTTYGVSKRLILTLKDVNNNFLVGKQISIKLKNVKYTLETNSKGKASLAIPTNLPSGTYIATISYGGNSEYESSSTVANVIVNSLDIDISAVYKASNSEILSTLTNGATGKAVVGANVQVEINGVTTTVKTNTKGQAKVSTADLPSGTYTANVSFAGNFKYGATSINITFATRIDSIISAVYDTANSEIVATLISTATGNALSNANVKISFNSESTTVKTNSKGQVKVSTAGLPLGTYPAKFSYAGNSRYNPASTSINVEVKTKVIITDVYAYSDRIVAKLTNGATAKAIANANMIVEINGVKYNAKSDNKGLLTFDTTCSDLPSSYDLTISYRGNDRYTASSATVAVDLNKANMMITTNYHADKQKMVATLKNSKTGKVVSNANMIIDLNGVKTTYKSNDQGKITLPTADFAPGTYVGTVTYPGNARYNSISAVFKVDV